MIKFFEVVLTILLVTSSALSEPDTTEPAVKAEQQLTIESQKMEADLNKNLVVFLDKVLAVDKDYKLSADKLTVFLCNESRGPEKIVAEGKVKITQQNLVSESDRATIIPNEDKVILDGNARVRQGVNVFSGKSVEYIRSTGKVLMREGVRVSIFDVGSLEAPQGTSKSKKN